MSAEATRLIELIDDAARQLTEAGVSFGHGTTNAFDEAAWLVLWRLGLPLDTPLDGPESAAELPVQAAQCEQVAALLSERIGTRKPAAYLTREAWLQGVPFYVDERAIVPRSLIGELLAHPELGGGIDPWLGAHTARVLDLCTGNGSLAVLAAMVYPDVTVDAADISADALAVARINVDRHALQDRIRLIESDSPGVGPGPLRPDPLQPALRQCWQHGRPARRIPGRALFGACGRRRRHGLRPPAAARGACASSAGGRAGPGNRP
jgi:ribosomal protein L3 glutamine methyltransferase